MADSIDNLSGVVVDLVTPFNDGKIDEAGLCRLVDFVFYGSGDHEIGAVPFVKGILVGGENWRVSSSG